MMDGFIGMQSHHKLRKICTSNEQLDTEIKSTVPFTITQKKKKKVKIHNTDERNKSRFNKCSGNSLVVQCLGLGALTAEGPGSIPCRGTKIPQAVQHGQKKKKK